MKELDELLSEPCVFCNKMLGDSRLILLQHEHEPMVYHPTCYWEMMIKKQLEIIMYYKETERELETKKNG